MFDPLPLLKMAPIFAVALALPGPDFFMISSLSLSRGRWAAFLASCGIAAGNLLWAALCILGFAAIAAKVGGLLLLVRVGGGLYLIYLGYSLWKASFAPCEADRDVGLPVQRKRHPFIIGVTTNLTNPKALAFFTSIFAVALPAQAGAATQVAMLALIVTMSVAWFGFVGFCLSASAMRAVYLRWSRWIDRAAGTCLAFFGGRLLLLSRN